MTDSPSSHPVAGPVKRLAAMVYDSLLLFGVLFTATLIPALILDKGMQPSMENEQVVHELNPLLTGLPFQLYLVIITAVFFCWFWRSSGQTLGMQAWKLQLQDYQGQLPTIRQCLIRLFVATFSLLLLGAGYWWIWLDKDSLSWHDRASKTRVVVLPK